MRLIDADAIEYTHAVARNLFDGHNWNELVVTKDEIEDMPTIQPDIVRCKDCKYAEYIDDVQTLWCTECGQGRTVAPDDFCSYAGRREVTT